MPKEPRLVSNWLTPAEKLQLMPPGSKEQQEGVCHTQRYPTRVAGQTAVCLSYSSRQFALKTYNLFVSSVWTLRNSIF